jgi:ABC-2 type transport system permease protein
MYLLADTWYLLEKYLRLSIRMPLWTLFGLIQPLIWLVIFGQLFKTIGELPGFPAGSYLEFLTPGILVMTVLFGSSWSGVNLLREINFRIIEKMLVTVVSRESIVLSRVLHSCLILLVQTWVILLVGLLMGVRIPGGIVGFLWCSLIAGLLGIGFSSLSNGLAMLFKKEEPLVVMGNFMTLPVMFLSSAFVPQEFLPSWIAAIAMINPVQYAVEAMQMAFGGQWYTANFVAPITVLLFFTGVTFGWAAWLFKRRKD